MSIQLKNEKMKAIFDEHSHVFEATFTQKNRDLLDKIANYVAEALRRGNKILLCGNGGSAADAQHIAAEFVGRFHRERVSLAAIALTTDTSVLTAVANDFGYESVFSRQVEGLGKPGDILIAISTSGNSPNVLKAVTQAKHQQIITIGMTGAQGGGLKAIVDLNFCVSSSQTPHIQEMHITALHAVSERVEQMLHPS